MQIKTLPVISHSQYQFMIDFLKALSYWAATINNIPGNIPLQEVSKLQISHIISWLATDCHIIVLCISD